MNNSDPLLLIESQGNITNLQKAMGHSSINVSLTYLRGLEIPELQRRGYADDIKKPSTREGISYFKI